MSALPTESLSPEVIDIILNGPGAATPDGSAPNFVNPTTLRPVLYTTLGLSMSLSTIFLAARLYTKGFVIRKFHSEDYSITIGWIFFMAFCSETLMCTPLGATHIWDTRVRDIFQVLYYANIIEILYNPTILSVKLAILLQYRRIFVPARRNSPMLFYGIVTMIIIMSIFYLILTFFIIFICSPREASWNRLLPGRCFDINGVLVSAAVFNLVSDLIILAMPQYSIWKLRMAGRRKLGISAIFGLGGVACIVTALRVQSTVQLIQTQDATWYLVPTAMWAIAEVTLGIICCCLPIIPKFFQTVKGNLSKTSHSGPSYASRGDSVTYVSSEKLRSGKGSSFILNNHNTIAPECSEIRESWQSTSAGTWYCESDSEVFEDVEASASKLHSLNLQKPLPALHRDENKPDRIMRTVQIEWRESRQSPTLESS